MKKNILFLSVFITILLLSACGADNSNEDSEASASNQEDEVKKIRAGITLSPESSLYKGLEHFKEIVEEESDNSIEVELYHSGELGDDRSLIEGLQVGSLEMAAPITGSLSGFTPAITILDFPFLFPNEEVVDEVLDGESGQQLLDLLEDQNILGLGYWENGFRNLSNNIQPVESLEDWEGLSIRSMPNEMSIDAMRALGANPTPMAFTEVFTALQQGTIDGQENPNTVIYDNKIYEVQNYLSETKHSYSAFTVMISKNFYDGLSEEQQNIVSNAVKETTSYQRDLNRQQSEEFLELIIESGIEYTEVSETAREEMREATEPVLEEYTKELGEEHVKSIRSAIEEAE